MKQIFLTVILILSGLALFSQERVVYVDFESSSFKTNPTIPFDQPFGIQGEVASDVELVEVDVLSENTEDVLHSFTWNRKNSNQSPGFKVVVPPVLKSNTKYDFLIKTYKLMTPKQKKELKEKLRERVVYLLRSNIIYDGNDIEVQKPKHVYKKLSMLIDEALKYQRSKNQIERPELSRLVCDELERYADFKFKDFLKPKEESELNEQAKQLVEKKIEGLADVVMSEVNPYINSDLVQLHRQAYVKSVPTDKEPFTLPVNFGMYAWSKSIDVGNTTSRNLDFTPAIGFTVPFASRSSLLRKSKTFDSFGYSMGVLLNPVKDANGTEYITPTINLPVYAGLGVRVFKVLRLNAGALMIAKDGQQNFSSFNILPTAGLALELDVWMGIKK
ncbi:MAG: hypothetical protein K9I29_00755 [Bacteroidales bacterium]|nr:hypothetical protein [Bacteroidales bacterium]MCF8326796.1 hypothetical protein [Bacteroidales bacterium]